MTISADFQYLLDCLGGAAIFVCCWWAFCFLVRNGIDGGKAVVRAIKHKKPLLLRKILIGDWKPLPEYKPFRADVEIPDD
jgi:hypothetical protein